MRYHDQEKDVASKRMKSKNDVLEKSVNWRSDLVV